MTTAVLTGLAAICVAGVGFLGVLYGQLMPRVNTLEETNRSLWSYTRRVLDLYYRHRRDGAPDPPDLPTDI